MEENKVVETSTETKGSDIKATVIKCIAAILCVVLVMVTMSQCITNVNETNLKIAEQQAQNAGSSVDSSSDDISGDYTDDTAVIDDTVADDGAIVDDTASGDVVADDSAATDAPAADNNSSSSSNATASKAPSTKAEIVSYFNTASNKVKTSAKSVTKVKEENYQAQSIDLGSLGMFKSIVNKLINDNMGVNEEQSGRTGTSAADKNAIYPVENETWASKLTVSDVKTASCTEKNGVYTITLTLVDDPLATTYSHGSGHHGKAFSIVMPQTIKDNAGGAASLLDSLKVGYQNGKIVVTVDAATGNITSAKYDYVWLLNIDMFGGITAHFGIKTDYTIKW